jgi:hypothetical protein
MSRAPSLYPPAHTLSKGRGTDGYGVCIRSAGRKRIRCSELERDLLVRDLLLGGVLSPGRDGDCGH